MSLEKIECLFSDSADSITQCDIPAIEAVDTLVAGGYHAVHIDRAPVVNQETLMHALYQGLALPGYFGFNWDALQDCLTALDIVDQSKGTVLVFNDLSQLGDAAATLREVVKDVNDVLSEHSEPPLRILAGKL